MILDLAGGADVEDRIIAKWLPECLPVAAVAFAVLCRQQALPFTKATSVAAGATPKRLITYDVFFGYSTSELRGGLRLLLPQRFQVDANKVQVGPCLMCDVGLDSRDPQRDLPVIAGLLLAARARDGALETALHPSKNRYDLDLPQRNMNYLRGRPEVPGSVRMDTTDAGCVGSQVLKRSTDGPRTSPVVEELWGKCGGDASAPGSVVSDHIRPSSPPQG